VDKISQFLSKITTLHLHGSGNIGILSKGLNSVQNDIQI